MIIEKGPTKEFLDYIDNVYNDQKYQEETLPALKFLDNSEKYVSIEISEFIENENDPPDFDIVLADRNRIALEVTSFSDPSVPIHKFNSFFRDLESILKPIISKNIHLLPNGFYEFFYFPGPEKIETSKGLAMEIPNFKHKIGKNELQKKLKEGIPQWFEEYKLSKQTSFTILNKKGQQVGKITMIKWTESDQKKIIITPQLYSRMKDWTENELNNAIQNIIIKKEKTYLSNDGWAKGYCQVWLLISDIHNIMGTCNSEIEKLNIKASSYFFDKIYLIQDMISNYRIVSIRINRNKPKIG